MISSNRIWHQDQQNLCRTQSIRWLKVTRLFHSANIALELFRICSKGTCISPFFITSTTVADQRLLLGFINTLTNLFLLSFHIRRAHQTGPWSLVWISCWIVFHKFVVPWQWADFLHLRDMLKSRNWLYHWYEINLTEQTHIIVSCSWLRLVTTNGTLIWLGNQCATHQLSSFFQTNTARPSRISKNSMLLECLCLYSWRSDQH